MSHNKNRSRRWGLALAALTVTLAVLATPAAAKAPVLGPVDCPQGHPRAWVPIPAACEGSSAVRQTTGDSTGSDTSGATVAGSLAILVLLSAGGLLFVTHRREAQERQATALSGVGQN